MDFANNSKTEPKDQTTQSDRNDDRSEGRRERSDRRERGRSDAPRTSALSRVGRRLSATQTDLGSMEDVIEVLTNLSKEPTNQEVLKTEVIPLIKDLHAPIVLIAAQETFDGVPVVFYQPIIMEALGKGPLTPYIPEHDRGSRDIIDVPTVAIFDDVAKELAERELRERFKLEDDAEFYHSAQIVFPKLIDVKDPTYLGVVYSSAVNWLADMLGGLISTIDHELLTEDGVSLVQEPLEVVRGTVVTDPLGNPVSTDFISRLKLIEDHGNRRNEDDYLQVNRADYVDSVPVVTANIQLDFVMSDNQQANPDHLIHEEPNRRNFQGYMPVIVMTSCHNSQRNGRRIEDYATQLFGLVACLPVASDYGWVRLWEHAGKNSHKANLGLLTREWDPTLNGLEGKETTMTASSSDEPKANQVRPIDLAKAMVHSQALIAMDFVMGSYSAPYQAIFSDAAKENEEKAIETIYDAADAITDGYFSELAIKEHGERRNPLVHETNTVHGGNYASKDGRRDVRDFDYLAAAEAAGGDRQMMADATAAVYMPGIEDVAAQTLRRNILTKVLHDAEINTLVTRVYFEGWFVPMLVEALEKAAVHFLNDDENPYVELRGERNGLSVKRFGSDFSRANKVYSARAGRPGRDRRNGFVGQGTGRYYR